MPNARPSNAPGFASTRGVMAFTTQPQIGDLWFTNSTNTSASATGGYTPFLPTATLIQAQTLAAANNADTVYVGAGHAESIVGAAGMTFSKAGVSYKGLGNGRARPTITFSTSTAAQMIVSGAQISFDNMVFDFTGIDAIVAAISVTVADVSFTNCDFICQNSTIGVVRGFLTAATASRFKIDSCRFLGVQTSTGTTMTACISHEVGENFQITNNFFVGKMTQAILNASTILDGLIAGNQFHIYTGTKAITLASGTTGSGFNNRMVVASGTTPVVGTGFSWNSNGYTTEALTIGTPTAGAF